MPESTDQKTALFPTLLYRAEARGATRLNLELEAAALELARDDRAGQRWCAKHGYGGYTSFASIAGLSERFPAFARLERMIDGHAARFARALHWDLRGGRPICDSMWVNMLSQGGSHTSHLHTNAVLSGTYYVTVPEGSAPIVFEDPRHASMMAVPPRKTRAPREVQTNVSEKARPGTLLLWESWLRHEVPLNRAERERISVSFNYVIG
jgi:uncharacterized protein (TIGR02466 family)